MLHTTCQTRCCMIGCSLTKEVADARNRAAELEEQFQAARAEVKSKEEALAAAKKVLH